MAICVKKSMTSQLPRSGQENHKCCRKRGHVVNLTGAARQNNLMKSLFGFQKCLDILYKRPRSCRNINGPDCPIEGEGGGSGDIAAAQMAPEKS